MTGEYLTAPGLLAYVFLAAGSQDADDGWTRLRSLWVDVARQLGLDRPVPRLRVPAHLPRERASAGELGLLAAAERGEAPAWQASAWADPGVLGLTAMMTSARAADGPGAWTDLERTWQTAVAGLAAEGVLGEIRVFHAVLLRPPGEGPALDDDMLERASDPVRAAVPGPTRAGWWQHWDAVPLGSPGRRAGEVLVWEIGPESRDARIVRRLAVVATAQHGRRVDEVMGTNGDGTLTALARHLMHAARLRGQIRVFDEGKRSRQQQEELDPLITLRAELDTMRHAAAVIEDGLRHAMDLPASAAGPLSEDRQLAVSFGQRLDDEITRLDAAVRNAQLVRRVLAEQRPVPVGSPADATPVRQPPGRLQAFTPSRRTGSGESWVVVFTALGVEYQAVREYLVGPVWLHEERGTLYEVGTLPGARGYWHIALTQTGAGSTTAGVQLDRAARVFAPEVALFLGVAGGRKDVALGDVVVADKIYDYEWGKSTLEGFQPRMRIHYPAHRLLQRAQLVARENRWQQRIRPSCPEPPPASFVKPIVTGAKVIAHHHSATALLLDRYASDALAVETEGYGFLEAAHVNPEVDALVIRGISDLLVGKDQANDDFWQPVAARHAAAFAIELLDSIGSNRT